MSGIKPVSFNQNPQDRRVGSTQPTQVLSQNAEEEISFSRGVGTETHVRITIKDGRIDRLTTFNYCPLASTFTCEYSPQKERLVIESTGCYYRYPKLDIKHDYSQSKIHIKSFISDIEIAAKNCKNIYVRSILIKEMPKIKAILL